MRAGTLDRSIRIERITAMESETYGAVFDTWAPLTTLRAQLIESSVDDFQRAHGASTETAVVFRTRYYAGITLADRVAYQGAAFKLKKIKEIGRRKGLELRCERVGP